MNNVNSQLKNDEKALCECNNGQALKPKQDSRICTMSLDMIESKRGFGYVEK